MFLLNIYDCDYDKDIIPFLINGIIIDTSVIKIIIDGLVSTRISGKDLDDSSEYQQLIELFELLKVNNRWDKFIITPHILTEVCTHLHNDYSKKYGNDFYKVINEIFPLLENIVERIVEKDSIINHFDFKKAIIEIGDISIFVVANDLLATKKKVAILADDRRINGEFKYNPNVMVLDFRSIVLNM